ncbi:MAG: hypothetical protein HQL26_10145 [Candidatus Omnitrophica bacterium]|nr:hypothetical protein [Candidatus Omnitrophota bacterium]
MKKYNLAQSTVEYLLVFAIAVAVIIIFLNPHKSVMKKSVNETLTSGLNRMGTVSDKIFEK